MTISTGCDIVKIDRVLPLIESEASSFRIFHPGELRRRDPLHAAGVFALKEAALKAFGLKAGSWLDIEVIYAENGKPSLKISPEAHQKTILSLDCSISHDCDYAIATVTLLEE
ncbi:MAG: 4'-phosphopantetheinyl transferase superfamily protein [bacterium]